MGPLVKVKVYRASDTSFRLFLNFHHIVFDGWSLSLFMSELSELYRSQATGREPVLPDLSFQFPEYAADQLQILEAGGFERQLDYWNEILAGVPQSLQMRTDFARPRVRGFRGRTFRFGIPAPLGDDVSLVAAKLDVTPSTIFLAVWAIALARHARQYDLVIGVPMASRYDPQSENLIGFFTNTLPLRLMPEPDKKFMTFVREVWVATLQALNCDVPLSKILARIDVQMNAGRNPLFQAVFNYEADSKDHIRLHDSMLTWDPEPPTGTSKFDVSLHVIDCDSRLDVGLEFDTDLFTGSTIRDLAESYITILGGTVSAPESRIGTSDLG
jgi:hypothetical protein